jgi:pyrimidine-specific ribonucleoside hydrolase
MAQRSILLSGILTLFLGSVHAQASFHPDSSPMRIIFDTDFGPDYDDVGAITLLHCFADSGYIRILGTMASSRHKNVAAAINVFNTYFNRPEIPVGVVGGKAVELGDRQHWTDSVISRYPHQIRNNSEATDALILYRKLLAAQPDHSVTIITVGFLTNLANLLESPPDIYSELNGYELVSRKINKLVCMGGRFPSGKEFNLAEDVKSTKKVLADWPGSILFSGFEIGQKIKTGIPLINNVDIRESPVKDVFAICIPMAVEDSAGRMSWDETAVFVAVKGWQNYYELETGRCKINEEGIDEWKHEKSTEARLIEKMSPEKMSQILNRLIMHQPMEQASRKAALQN